MSHDIVSDALNMIMNAKKAGKTELYIIRHSKFLMQVLDIAKKYEYLDYKIEDKKIKVWMKELSECRVIKPRYNVTVKEIEKYVRRYMPARDFGIIIVSTSSGLLTHKEAEDKNLGGSLIAFFY